MKILLFDIDGTLLRTGGAGLRALQRAFLELHGIEHLVAPLVLDGRTDPVILSDLFLAHLGRAIERVELTKLFDVYLGHLEKEIERSPAATLLPGIPELLGALAEVPGVACGLLTGNTAHGAHIKLRHFGIEDRFVTGAFSSDADTREEIARVARQRAEDRAGGPLGRVDLLVIGDTPADIACGKAIGASTVAVATGHFTRELLSGYGPDFLFEDFRDTADVLGQLVGRS